MPTSLQCARLWANGGATPAAASAGEQYNVFMKKLATERYIHCQTTRLVTWPVNLCGKVRMFGLARAISRLRFNFQCAPRGQRAALLLHRRLRKKNVLYSRWRFAMERYAQTVYNTKGTRAHTHRELIRTWLWEPKGSSLEYI